MFEIKISQNGIIELSGRFDAAKLELAKGVFSEINDTTKVDFRKLDYISSAGLSVLLLTQKRLKGSGKELLLINMNNHIREIFKYAGFDLIFQIQ